MAKRRSNGEGNIRKRKDGRWEGRFTAGHDPKTGKAIIKNVLAATQNEAKIKLRKEQEYYGIVDVTSDDYLLREWMPIWYENYSKPSIKETTAAHYKSLMDNHILPALGEYKLRDLRTFHIQQLYRELLENGWVKRYGDKNPKKKGLSVKTVRSTHMLLRQCLQQAVEEHLIPFNPADKCKLPPKEKHEMHVLPMEKVKDYLEAAREHGVYAMFYLELSTGLRRGELAALLWTDLDTKNKCIHVTKSAVRVNGHIVVSDPKTCNSVRKVYVDDEIIRVLMEDRRNHPFNPYMFPSPVTGEMIAPDSLGRIHKKLLERAGIEEKVRFHDLRHTFATIAISSGVDPKTLSSMLGHSSAEFTLNTYTHVTPSMQRNAAKIISEAMTSVG